MILELKNGEWLHVEVRRRVIDNDPAGNSGRGTLFEVEVRATWREALLDKGMPAPAAVAGAVLEAF